MHNARPIPNDFSGRSFDPASIQGTGWNGQRDEYALIAMLTVFRPGGGVVTGDELAELVRKHRDQAVSVVAQWVVRRAILCFGWRGQTLVPLFQFDRATMLPRPEVTRVVRELAGAFDEWEIGWWFAHPNSWLEGELPVRAIGHDALAVLRAAQADRFIARG